MEVETKLKVYGNSSKEDIIIRSPKCYERNFVEIEIAGHTVRVLAKEVIKAVEACKRSYKHF